MFLVMHLFFIARQYRTHTFCFYLDPSSFSLSWAGLLSEMVLVDSVYQVADILHVCTLGGFWTFYFSEF